MFGWRNILTAPKNKRILVCGNNWSDSQGPLKEPVIAQWNESRERWETGTGILGTYGIRPTHWQPLPEVYSTSSMDPKHMIYVDTGRVLSIHAAVKVVLAYEGVPFDVVTGPHGAGLLVEPQHLDKMNRVANEWGGLRDSIPRALFNATVDYQQRNRT